MNYILKYIQIDFSAGAGCQYNVRLTLDRSCFLVENENRVDLVESSIWREFDFDLMLDFGYTT